MINFPYLPGDSSFWSNITWTDVTIDANGYADMCWDFEAPADAYFARLGCRNAIGGRSHWRFGAYPIVQGDHDPIGTVPQGYNGMGFQTTIDDIFDIKDGATGPGANITITLGAGGSLDNSTYTIQPGGPNVYNSVDRVMTRPVIIKGTCSNTPVAVATVATPTSGSTSALQSINFTTPGTGCTGTIIVAVPDLALSTFSGEIALSDSQISNVVCNSSGMTCVNGKSLIASSFGNFHPTNTGNGFTEYGTMTFTGRQECDSLYLSCILRNYYSDNIPTSISNAYAYNGGNFPNSEAYTGSQLYNFSYIQNLIVDGQRCLYPGGTNGCGAFGFRSGHVTGAQGGSDLYVVTDPGWQTYIGGNNATQVIFNGTGVYPAGTQDFGGNDALWNNGYFNNLHYNNIIMPELTRDVGKTCKIAGFVTLKINGRRRKLAFCE